MFQFQVVDQEDRLPRSVTEELNKLGQLGFQIVGISGSLIFLQREVSVSKSLIETASVAIER